HHTLGACGVSIMALPLLQKLKWTDFPQSRYLLLRHSRTVVQRYLGQNIASALAAKLTDAALLLHRAAIRALTTRTLRNFRVKQVPQMSPDLDEKLRAQTPPISVHRSRLD